MPNKLRVETAHIEKNDGTIFEGIISIRAILETGSRAILELLISREHAKKYPRELGYLKAKSHELGYGLRICEEDEISTLATGATHGGLIARCGERELSRPGELVRDGFYVMLDGIEDPYNFGYALRSLYAAGVDGVVLPPRSWMSAGGIVCRASAGASERLSLYTATPEECLSIFGGAGYSIVCADIENSVSLYEARLERPLLLVVGGERRGISRVLLEAASEIVRIDYGREFGAALSAASAATVLGFEVLRRSKCK